MRVCILLTMHKHDRFYGTIMARIMRALYKKEGFTVIEVLVALTIIGLFITLFFQLFFVGQSQQVSAIRLAAANDLAQINLRKITSRNQITPASANCDSSNDLTQNANATGSDITFTAETSLSPSLPPSSQPGGVQQAMKVVYPQGCDLTMPAKIMSIVTYGTGLNVETVQRVSYVNYIN